MNRIHETAIIEGNVSIGENVIIGPYSVLSGDIYIGNNTIIGAYVHITGKVRIGENNRIHHSVSIGQPPQDTHYKGESTEVIIGNDNIIREFATIHKATGEGNKTVIGNGNYIMAYVHIAHNCKIGNGVVIANMAQLAGHVEIDDFAFISGVLGVHQWCRIGAYAMVGGMTRLNQDAPPFFITSGYEPRVVGLNIVGLRRRGFTDEEIYRLKEAYKIIYRSSYTLDEAMDILMEKFPDDRKIKYLVEFYNRSKRGVVMRC